MSHSESFASTITVEVLYLSPTKKWRRTLTLPAGSNVEQAIAASEIHQHLPETKNMPFGIYGEQVNANRVLNHRDRIEYYRNLVFDPMESRRRRAEHRAKQLEKERGNKPISAASRMLANQQPKK